MKCGVDKFCLGATSACCIHGMYPGTSHTNLWRSSIRFITIVYESLVKGAVSYFTHIFFSFFLAFLQTSYGFILIKTYKLHYFYLPLYSETTDRGEITVTTTSGLDLCIFPCFKYIVYQINSFALIAKWFPSIFIILVLFFVRNYRVSHHAHPRLRAPSLTLNLKTLAQRFQVCYAQKHMREIWHCSFKISWPKTWKPIDSIIVFSYI